MGHEGLILIEERGDVALVGLNDPGHLNAISLPLITALHGAITERARQGARKFLIHGMGASFSSGAHMDDYLRTLEAVERHEAEAFYESERQLLEVARLLRRPSVFSVAAVHGWVIGAGLELALACDFLVAGDDATFWFPETAAGWNVGMGATQRLVRRVGDTWARRLLLLGEKIPAGRAAEIGLATRTAPAGQHVEHALALFEELGRRSPLALQYQKRLLDVLPSLSLDDSMELEVITGHWLAHTADVREAARAFVERRPPRFQGK